MKKVKFKGDNDVLIPSLGLDVKNGDVIEVSDDFFNALFEEVVEEVKEEKTASKNKEVK